jgi:hypothetical protein
MIGEPLHEKLNVGTVEFDPNSHQYYANHLDAIQKRPLDFGRLCYYKLWAKFKNESHTEVEAYHDHTKREVRCVVKFPIAGSITGGRQVKIPENMGTAPDHVEAGIDYYIEDLYQSYEDRRITNG